jgi:EAL domain-containing protein (putative c-di-GMP-specific phosphodiesterase class I)
MATLAMQPSTGEPKRAEDLSHVLRSGGISSYFQPIIDLQTGSVAAYEALARGPRGPLHTPDALFSEARTSGMLAALDDACRVAAFRSAREVGLTAPLTMFVNVEPEVLDSAPLEDLLALADLTSGELHIVLELTERALVARPAELLRTVERVRQIGWGIALDDVGADPSSLAFMSLLRPDVIKLDLSLIQQWPTPAIATIMHAVNAFAERRGALILAEGIETEKHLAVAHGLGATLGQGWLFGRPTPTPDLTLPVRPLSLPPSPPVHFDARISPFSCLPPDAVLRQSTKALLVELSKQLEYEAMRIGEMCVVASTFQHARHFTTATADRYSRVAKEVGFACALGEDIALEPVPNLRGVALRPGDPLMGEWDVAVISPHFSAALVAREVDDSGYDMERMFEYALTYRRDTVVRVAHALLSRVAPQMPTEEAPAA